MPRRALGLVALLLTAAVAGLGALAFRGGAATGLGSPAVLLAAGDIAGCSTQGDEATAALIEGQPGTVATLGDNAYQLGSAREYGCYDASWGKFKARTRPAVGNHEYATPGATPYFDYFGAAAGPRGKGYYSYELGRWHVVVLNSNCAEVSCEVSSPQGRWLRRDLAAHRTRCTLAYWHHPRFSSGLHGNDVTLQPFWQLLYRAGADVVLSGHDHDYERFAPQAPAGRVDLRRGIREFVAGTGGRSHYPILAPTPNSRAHNDDTFGVLKLTLSPRSYAWKFLPEAGKSFTDAGSAVCH
jgi:acid phosphatase type 7